MRELCELAIWKDTELPSSLRSRRARCGELARGVFSEWGEPARLGKNSRDHFCRWRQTPPMIELGSFDVLNVNTWIERYVVSFEHVLNKK